MTQLGLEIIGIVATATPFYWFDGSFFEKCIICLFIFTATIAAIFGRRAWEYFCNQEKTVLFDKIDVENNATDYFARYYIRVVNG